MARSDSNSSTVAGLFYDRLSAEAAIQQLTEAGFPARRIGVGAAAGGILGALVGMGISEEHARHLERGFERGGILLTVESGERSSVAREIMAESGGDIGPGYEGGESDGVRSFEPTDRRRGNDPAYSGPERRLASRR